MILLCFLVTLNTLHSVLFNLRLTRLESSWKFDRSFCRADASEISKGLWSVSVTKSRPYKWW